MVELSYEDIDLFYYHSIDIDFSRFYSILNYGIVSQNAAKEENLKYYYRNYTHSSAKNDFVSINHFPRTIFRYYKVENELYDFNTHKICFIVDGVNALDKQYYKKWNIYTNERHVYYKIEPSKIKGVLLREVDASKPIIEISFNSKFTDKAFLEHKIFSIMQFFTDFFGPFVNAQKIYYLIGKLREARICNLPEEIIVEQISREMRNSIHMMLSKAMHIEIPTLLDAIEYINAGKYPIYIMNRFDIQKKDCELKHTDDRLEKFKELGLSKKEMHKKEMIDKKTARLIRKMSNSGVSIYCGDTLGPLSKEDQNIAKEIHQLRLKR